MPVFLDRNAFEGADLIVPINRVKVHTDFTGPIESGLMKMIAIGLGKQKGADAFHRQGFAVFDTLIPEVATYTIARAPIPFGIALIKNGHARLRHIEAVPAERIATREPELLVMSTEALARLPFATIDVLILDDIGKDVSGLGMDSNVGRYPGQCRRHRHGRRRTAPGRREDRLPQDLHEHDHGQDAGGRARPDHGRHRSRGPLDRPGVLRQGHPRECPDSSSARHQAPRVALRQRVPAARPGGAGACEVVRPLRPIGFDAAGMLVDPVT